jgi:hypothetical protein
MLMCIWQRKVLFSQEEGMHLKMIANRKLMHPLLSVVAEYLKTCQVQHHSCKRGFKTRYPRQDTIAFNTSFYGPKPQMSSSVFLRIN